MRLQLERWAFAITIGWMHACAGNENCDHEDLEDGDYVLRQKLASLDPEFQWLVGAEVHVDREARLVTIRYERDGTTYEVRGTIDP